MVIGMITSFTYLVAIHTAVVGIITSDGQSCPPSFITYAYTIILHVVVYVHVMV